MGKGIFISEALSIYWALYYILSRLLIFTILYKSLATANVVYVLIGD